MQKYNKSYLGGAGGGVGAALAQLMVIFEYMPPEGEAALTIILAAALGAILPAVGWANQE